MKKDKDKTVQAAKLRRLAEAHLRRLKTAEARSGTEPDTLRLVHELQVHQVELEMQNEELMRARTEVEAGLERYTDLYDFAPVGYFTLDRDGTILQVNITGAGLLGIERSQLVHRSLGRFIESEDLDRWDQHLMSALQSAQKQTCELTLKREDGSTFHSHLDSISLSWPAQEGGDGGPNAVIRVAMSDITERKRIEETQLFLWQCGFRYEGEDFFKALAVYLAQSLGMDYVCIDRLQGDGLAAQTVAIHFDGQFQDNVEYTLKDTPCGDVVGKATCCFPKGVRHLFPKDVVLQEMMAESYVGATLWSFDGKPIGLIAVIGRKPLANPRLAESVLKLVAVRAAGELERKQAEERLKEIVRLAPAFICILRGREHVFEMCNDRYIQVVGRRDILNLPVRQALPELAGQGFFELLDSVFETGKPYSGKEVPVRLQRMPGGPAEEVYVDFVYMPLRGADDSISGIFVHGVDLTEQVLARRQIEQLAQQAQRTAEELEQRVGERTAELSETVGRLHDEVQNRIAVELSLREQSDQLRALASELTMAEQRERHRLAQILHDDLQQLLVAAQLMIAPLGGAEDEAVRRAAAQVSDLIRLSIDASRSLTGELSPPILHEGGLIPSLEWLTRWMQEKHGLQVDLQFDGQAAPQAKDVTVLLFQAVRELLFNVAKHAKVQSARVEVVGFDGQLEVTVSDDGVGFDSTQLRFGGKTWGGFGLFSIRERLSYLGGRMEIISSPGRGSRFTLSVPVRPSATPATAGEFPRGSPGVAAPESGLACRIEKKIRVLLADDHRVMRQGLAHLLKEEKDIEIVGEAVDGEAAVNLARQLRPNVIIMDVSMPGMNGIEATRLIHAELPDIQVIGLSTFGEAEQAAEMRDAGAAAYLTKSGATDAVIAAIRACAGNAAEAPLQRLQSDFRE